MYRNTGSKGPRYIGPSEGTFVKFIGHFRRLLMSMADVNHRKRPTELQMKTAARRRYILRRYWFILLILWMNYYYTSSVDDDFIFFW